MGSRGVKACSCVWGWGGENPDRLDFWAFPLGVDGHVGVKGRETSTQAWETLEALRHGRCGRGTWAGMNGSQHFAFLPSPLQPVLPPSGSGLKEQIARQLSSPQWREKAWTFQTLAAWERRKSFPELSWGDGVGLDSPCCYYLRDRWTEMSVTA